MIKLKSWIYKILTKTPIFNKFRGGVGSGVEGGTVIELKSYLNDKNVLKFDIKAKYRVRLLRLLNRRK